ncbi:glycerophosphodiester phosphodiesterase family protein [Aneurinibacillus sp. Ricciae_BoGa-3]|uniref:glycerophosphodiester phosphodiesterase n=1 Tax=Aneurinibacillus sp. Ricciae_BoGa-3 TaxID=3022697 RepID=UPI0023400253|nr:glycerophosphodiester phosphodiesterase family protein [Aneurinibacillus sp. Ricciae_BoGa-3]WCK53392.1 glycerophosphodiester phosphodiesterase family protein [Aneurinibacillus sp. Ricciae_BoGa-3]
MNDIFLIYAHRGSSIKYPENTILSFSKALTEGANGIELDVQLTKDKQVVVFHDLSLRRILKKRGQISDYTLKQIRQFDVGSWKNPAFKGTKIPTLDEVLRLASKHNIIVNIELKNLLDMKNGLEQYVIDKIIQYNMKQRSVISTFNPLSLKILQKKCKGIPYALLYFGFLNDPWTYTREYGCSYIHPPVQEVSELFIDTARANGLKIVPYQVNTLNDIQKMVELGVDGIITPRPSLAHRYLYE